MELEDRHLGGRPRRRIVRADADVPNLVGVGPRDAGRGYRTRESVIESATGLLHWMDGLLKATDRDG